MCFHSPLRPTLGPGKPAIKGNTPREMLSLLTTALDQLNPAVFEISGLDDPLEKVEECGGDEYDTEMLREYYTALNDNIFSGVLPPFEDVVRFHSTESNRYRRAPPRWGDSSVQFQNGEISTDRMRSRVNLYRRQYDDNDDYISPDRGVLLVLDALCQHMLRVYIHMLCCDNTQCTVIGNVSFSAFATRICLYLDMAKIIQTRLSEEGILSTLYMERERFFVQDFLEIISPRLTFNWNRLATTCAALKLNYNVVHEELRVVRDFRTPVRAYRRLVPTFRRPVRIFGRIRALRRPI
jgi:hypothetical protein